MLLQSLKEYADHQLALLPTLYSKAPVRYIVELDGSGRLLKHELTDTTNLAGLRSRRGQRRPMPQVQRSSGIRPMLLADNADYTFGLPRPYSNLQRVAACHQAYLDLLDRCADATHEPAVQAVCVFLHHDTTSQLSLPDDFDPSANITFRVDGCFPTDLPSVQRFWADVNDPAADPRHPAPVMQCLVCGRERPVLGRLQARVKGIPGGQTSGMALISANAEAFESYGLEASLVAPTCAACGESFTRAANELLADQSTHIVLGDLAFVFWTKEPVPFSFRDFFDRPEPERVEVLLGAADPGRHPPEADSTKFYATVLSGSGGRAVVCDWIETAVGEVRDHLRDWFQGQRIVSPSGEPPHPFGLYPLAAATVRDPARGLPKPLLRALWRTALTGSPLPTGLLYQAIRRNRAGREKGTRQFFPGERAALIKLVLRSQQSNSKEDKMVQLDPENLSPAYRCGRLLAVIERAQLLAAPGTRATVVDRFFGTASSAPATIFGRLLRGAQPYLTKLEHDRPGVYYGLQRRLEDIQAGLAVFPRTLTLEDQGVFALGYYHQRAFDRAQAREHHKTAPAPTTKASGITDEIGDHDPIDADAVEN
ncbi:MAG: type I-C CRISPR-associated protein Cas8c/Csd1 [Chloroflexi bacterium]|nr:type I-C CRISPR-associated protein Cas8c/Csd1 [Chloroflexota bacterium]